ncbi:MAG TPA: hypothetical protein VLV50_11215 [Stellaceae bacterium]|nr:hypothetical protein [Stellaceae bacterium]
MRTLAAAAILAISAAPALAYTDAGDRLFPATILLPQIGPSDDLYMTPSTMPLYGASGAHDRLTNTSVVYNKTITERFSMGIEDGWNQLQQPGSAGGTAYGWQNLETTAKYLAILDPEHEFQLSLGIDREWGGTGAKSIANPVGATTPQLLFGKGMNELPWPDLKPFAIVGAFGYQIADAHTRADQILTSIAIEYSIPYLEAKVADVALPDFLRRVTPMIEFQFTTPGSPARGAQSAGLIAPGFNYAGEGWELGLEALIPATKGAGSGPGVIAQLHFSLDYLFPDTIGRPIFARH